MGSKKTFPQGNKSTTTIKKAFSSLLTVTAPEFRPGASTALPINKVNSSTGMESDVDPESNSFVNYNCQSFPFRDQQILAMRACFFPGLSLLNF